MLVGRRGGLEERVVGRTGLPLSTLAIRGLDLSDPWGAARALAVLPGAVLGARRLLVAFDPDVVVGAAGYVSVPVGAAARTAKRPLVLLEQNLRPGRAVRLLARGAAAVCVSFPETAALLPRRTRVVVTGNPLRPEVLAARPAPLGDRCRTILVMGGSQGARRINDAVVGSVAALLGSDDGLRVVHVCGERDLERVQGFREGLVEDLAKRYSAVGFVEDLPERIATADLVVMRAGGSSLAEVSALGRPMILVPYPHAGGHQEDNAAPYRDAGAAIVVADEDLTPERLRREIESLVADPGRWRAMAEASARMARRDATERVLEVLREVAR